MILAGDIGGTKVNLAFFTVAHRGLNCGVIKTYASRDYPSLETIIRAFLAESKARVEYACFGLAGPIREGTAKLTNLPWLVDAEELARVLKLKHVWLVNDVEANAHGIAGLTREDFFELNRGEENAAGNLAIISAGTGLGEAGLLWDGNRHLVIPSEGGHADFAPRTDLDIELLRHLRGRFGQVSWENVLSGPGSQNIYEFLRDTGRGEEPPWLAEEFLHTPPPVAITRAALEGTSPLCMQTLDLFVAYYGAEAGNLALKVFATGGVYLGGGIAPKLISKLNDGIFLKAFIGEGRMKNLLASIPVRVILNDKTALIGAARFAALKAGKMI
jgi:glucokinase